MHRPVGRRLVIQTFAMIVVLGLAASGCMSPARPITFESVAQGERSNYGFIDPDLVVLADFADISDLLRYRDLDEARAIRTIDISKSLLFLAFHGVAGSGGYGIEIVEVKQTGKQEVTVRAAFSSPGGLATHMTTSPYHIVRVPREELDPTYYRFILVDDGSGKEVARTERRIR